MKIERFEDLDCWKRARTLAGLIYDICENQHVSRDRRLRDQLTGSAISVMNNIAEGFGSQSNPEFKRFLNYARRSVSELQSCLYVACDRKFIGQGDFQIAYQQSEATRKVIDGMLRYLRSRRPQQTQRTKRTQLT
jgi:four helix bundle protein